MPAEFPQKISQIVVSAFQTDLCHRQVCFFQKTLCLLDAVFVDILYRGAADGFFEQPAEILLVQIYLSGKMRNVYFVMIIILNISKNRFDALHALVEVLFCR